MVKLDDVARLAGVSKGTASRVLNNRGYISEQTRRLVTQAMAELNYYPNENARNLLKRRSGMVGVIVPTITYPYYAQMISHLERNLICRGYKILLCNTAFGREREQDYITPLYNNRVDGVITFNYELDDKDYRALRLPMVSIDRYPKDGVSFVASNHVQGGTLAANHLLSRGCKYVIQISGPFRENTPWNLRHHVFKQLMEANGAVCVTHEQFADPHNFHAYRAIALELLRTHPEADGFFCNDLCAAAVLNAAASLNKIVPDQLKLIGYDGTLLTEIATPSITTILQDTEKIATSAVDILCQTIDNPDASACSLTVNLKLIERDSTRS